METFVENTYIYILALASIETSASVPPILVVCLTLGILIKQVLFLNFIYSSVQWLGVLYLYYVPGSG